ncbi:MAG TPA: LysM peptidoglycan-binding domain-containing protein [Chloroflexota bacterium]|nr:LysM peptidoglycan-binding domain-containing protein [Chloroflexota bacterium]
MALGSGWLALWLLAACGSAPPPTPTPLPRPTAPPLPTVPRPALDPATPQATGVAGLQTPGVQVIHQVRPGETLGAIAQQYYRDANRWQPIYEANRNVLTSPDAVQPGMRLVIPPLPAQ